MLWPVFYNATKKIPVSWIESGQVMRHGSTIMNQRAKKQSMEWKHLSSPVPKKFKQQSFCNKLMLMIFWDMNGPILITFQIHDETLNSATYCALVQDQLKCIIYHKWWGLIFRGATLHNVWLHTPTALVENMNRLNLNFFNIPLTAQIWHWLSYL